MSLRDFLEYPEELDKLTDAELGNNPHELSDDDKEFLRHLSKELFKSCQCCGCVRCDRVYREEEL